MKKIIMLAIVLATLAASAFSNTPDNIGKRAINNFNKTYAQAKEVQWESLGNYVKATFEMDGQKMYAYYRRNGELFAVTRNMLSSQLPMNLASELRDKRGNQWLTELFELSSDGETSYFATLTSADQIIVLKADVSGGWSVFKKTKRTDN